MNLFFKRNTSSGVTIIEAMLAVAILAIAIVGVLLLTANTAKIASVVSDRFIAANLAQEGVEIVRNIRDENWINGRAWDAGLGDTTASCVDYLNVLLSVCSSESSQSLYRNSGGGYVHNAAGTTPTKFRRYIRINKRPDADGVNVLEVLSVVSWDTESGKVVTAQDYLYDWK